MCDGARGVKSTTAIPHDTTFVGKIGPLDVGAYWQLSKPRVTLLVWLSALVALWLPGEPVSLARLVSLAVGVWLVVASANGLNETIEWRHDARMKRTANRPIPSGRLSVWEAAAVSTLWGVVGVAVLWRLVNPLTSLLGAFALLTYAFIYTPSKRLTPWCTVIGAVPGAIPPVMGWTAVTGSLNGEAVFLFVVQFLWQFPHFWAITWKYGSEYREAGFQMVPFHDEVGYRVGKAMLLFSVLLLLVSLTPTLLGWRSGGYASGALLLGWWMVRSTTRFVRHPDGKSAARVMLASLGYLPLWFALLMLTR